MAPSELNTALSVADERLKTAYTVAGSLLVFAAAAFVAVFTLHGITPNLAATASAISAVGAAAALAASRVCVWRREELYDEVVLSGYRHVGGDAVNRHAEALVSAERRLMLARTLERFLEISLRHQLTAVPLDRRTVRELEPHIRGLCARVRAVDVDVHAAGMVLLPPHHRRRDQPALPLQHRDRGQGPRARARDRAHPRAPRPRAGHPALPRADDRAAAPGCLGVVLRDQGVELRYGGPQAGHVDDDPLLCAAGEDDDRLLVERGVLLAVRHPRRHVDVVAGTGLDAPLLAVLEEHEHRMAGDDVDAGL